MYAPAKCNGVEFRPCISRQFMFSAVSNFCMRAKLPFLAASRTAALPRNKSATSSSPSLTKSNGIAPSLFFLEASAPCYVKNSKNLTIIKIIIIRNCLTFKSVKIKNKYNIDNLSDQLKLYYIQYYDS